MKIPDAAPRLLVHADLEPAVGSTFQPTGFPDLGAAEFERPMADGTTQRALLVESVQSMANRLEERGWDAPGRAPIAALARLPYVEVRAADGGFLSSSRLEPHRLAGAYVKEAKLDGRPVGEWMIERFGMQPGAPIDWRAVYAAIFELDPLCLLHGVFFSDKEWSALGNPKVRRAISAVIEAHDIRPAVSGGVKRDDVSPTARGDRNAERGYGFVPFGRTEYAAASIRLTASIDLQQLRGYGLDGDRTQLLVNLAAWEVSSLLSQPLRLRTACDLDVQNVVVARPDGVALPIAADLAEAISGSPVTFEADGPRTVVWG